MHLVIIVSDRGLAKCRCCSRDTVSVVLKKRRKKTEAESIQEILVLVVVLRVFVPVTDKVGHG